MGKSKDLATGETRFVNTAGDTMTGNLGVNVSPTAALDVRRSDADGKIAEFHQNGGYGFELSSSQTVARFRSGYLQAMSITTDAGSGAAERMRISKEGYITKPNQPCAVWGHSNDYSLVQDSSWRDVAANTTIFDKANNYSTSTYRFTAPVAGVYLVGFSGEFACTSATTWTYLCPRINGSNTANLSNKGNYMADFITPVAGYYQHSQTWLLNLSANDYFVFSHVGQGGNLTLKSYTECVFFSTLLG